MKTITTLFAAIAMSCAVQLVSAQGMGMGAPDFATMDTDSDGELSADELAALPFVQSGNAQVEELLTNWDTDSSGTVSEEEFNSRAMGMGMG